METDTNLHEIEIWYRPILDTEKQLFLQQKTIPSLLGIKNVNAPSCWLQRPKMSFRKRRSELVFWNGDSLEIESL